jgi:oligopeptide transport system ATP-binding protein
MYAGQVVESAPTVPLFERPANPYTRGLLLSVPSPTHAAGTTLYQIPGLPPDVAHLPPGCAFAPRCDRAAASCRQEAPPLVEVAPGHLSRCHFARDVYALPLAVRA